MTTRVAASGQDEEPEIVAAECMWSATARSANLGWEKRPRASARAFGLRGDFVANVYHL